MPYLGRRTVYIAGVAMVTTTLMLIGLLNVWTSNHSVALAQAVLTLYWTSTFQLSGQ
jgi:MFS transporter, SP family, general alpha glucoside:H+ symporter